jgi:hypothetical protein
MRSADEGVDTPCVPRPSGQAIRAVPSVVEKEPRDTARTRRRDRDGHAGLREASALAFAMDLPPNGALTITWPALLTAGEHSEGHCLGRGEPDRARHVRKELARLYRNEGLPFAALWGRHIGRTMAAHVHIFSKRPAPPPYLAAFQGRSSSTRVILPSGMRAKVSASQAWGSMPLSLAVSIKV